MTLVHRVLPAKPYRTLEAYRHAGGGRGLDAARRLGPAGVLDELEASGLRGRGGAGFPTHRKWRAVVANLSPSVAATVVVNGAEGEPGTYKDRAIVAADPYQVIEGAIIAASVVGATEVVLALKAAFGPEVARMRAAVAEVAAAGWAEGLDLTVHEGPDEYLYGEETALLEALEGRPPFPRIAPPWRRGATDVYEEGAVAIDEAASGLSARIDLAGPAGRSEAPPALVNNVETMANVTHVLAEGSDRFRSLGTPGSPGTIVCTITGDVDHAGVGEVRLGTPLRAVIDAISGGPRRGRTIRAVLVGVSGRVLVGDDLDTSLDYEAMAAVGAGVGSGGYIVLDDTADAVGWAAGVSRFLAVESCGQCTGCKADGLEISMRLSRLAASQAEPNDLGVIRHRLDTVANGARCSLATQHEVVVRSLLDAFTPDFDAHLHGSDPAPVALVAELLEVDDEGGARWDERHRDKQPDWTYDAVDSGRWPAERLDEHRRPEEQA